MEAHRREICRSTETKISNIIGADFLTFSRLSLVILLRKQTLPYKLAFAKKAWNLVQESGAFCPNFHDLFHSLFTNNLYI